MTFGDFDALEGPLALFIAAFLSATLLPGGSEALFLYQLHQGADATESVLVAGVGNTLGSIVTYGIGYAGNKAWHRWLRISEQQLVRAEGLFRRYGQPALLFAFLPVVEIGRAHV